MCVGGGVELLEHPTPVAVQGYLSVKLKGHQALLKINRFYFLDVWGFFLVCVCLFVAGRGFKLC